MHSGKSFNTVLGDMSFDKKGDVTGYTVGGKKKDRYVLYELEEGAGRQDQLCRGAVGRRLSQPLPRAPHSSRRPAGASARLVLGSAHPACLLRIGAAGPISGGSAAFGLQFKEGVEPAVADINVAGGRPWPESRPVRST